MSLSGRLLDRPGGGAGLRLASRFLCKPRSVASKSVFKARAGLGRSEEKGSARLAEVAV
jgi:hypothetical protein